MAYNTLPGFNANGLASQPFQGYPSAGGRTSTPNQSQNVSRTPGTQHTGQYVQSTYGWNSDRSNSSDYRGGNEYRDHTWQDVQNTLYNYPHPPAVFQSNTSTTSESLPYNGHYNGPSSQHTASGLNRLAYASGLEPPRSPVQQGRYTPHNEHQRQHARDGLTHAASRNVQPATHAVNHRPTSHAMREQRSGSSSSSHQMAIDAAVALAEAVQNRGRATNDHNRVSHSRPNSSMAVPLPTESAPIRQQMPPTQPARRPVPGEEPTGSSVNCPTPASSGGQQHNLSATHAMVPQENLQYAQTLTSTTEGLHRFSANSSSSVNSHNNSGQEDHQTTESDTQTPHYVNPMQVFNPYHREHEQKRREAEVNRANSSNTTATGTKGQSSTNSLHTDNDKQPAVLSNPNAAAAGKTNSNKTKATASKTKNSLANTGIVAPEQPDMAAELKAMMEKIKSFRTKDPSLFQKLWTDMRAKDGATSSIVPETSPTEAPIAKADTVQNSNSTTIRSSSASLIPNALDATQPKAMPTTEARPSGSPANGYKVVVENNSEGLPDLGRFPAERRIRQSYRGKDRTPKPPTTPAPMQAGGTPTTTPVGPPKVPPMRVSDNGWPESRRKAVSVAAIALLKAFPENKDTTTTAQDICTMLAKNPSYTDLCMELELRGLKFQRTAFARSLLQNIPDLNSKSIANATTSNVMELSNVIQESPLEQPLQNITVDEVVATNIDHESRPENVPGSQTAKIDKIIHYRPKIEKARGRNDIGVKEAAARKRDFSELVDLTELDDNEDYVVSDSKKARLETSTGNPESSAPVDLVATDSAVAAFVEAPPKRPVDATPLRFNPQVQTSSLTQPVQSDNRVHSTPQRLVPEPGVMNARSADGERRPHLILAREIDRAEAMKKTYYDPRTVARDILIGSGRHPSERPLNVHLRDLLYAYIDTNSDVSTFDWDAIDPGGPPMRKVEYHNVVAIPPKFGFGMRRKQRSRQSTPQTEKRGMPSRTSDTKSSLAHPTGAKGALKARHEPAAGEHPTPNYRPERSEAHLESSPLNKSASQSRTISINIPDLTQRSAPQGTQPEVSLNDGRKMEVNVATPKRRGRPPGAKNKYPTVAQLKKLAAQSTPVNQQTENIPPSPTFAKYRCKWVRCGSELHNLETLRKHIAKRHAPTDEEKHNAGCICWWKKCQYLHLNEDNTIQAQRTFENEEDWMAHIDADHLQPVALRFGDGPATVTGKPQVLNFDVSKFLYEPPIGPFTRTVSYTDPQTSIRARERFLSDENGRATTPAISLDGSPHLPHDVLELSKYYPHGPRTDSEKTNEHAQKAFMKAHGAKLEDHRRRAEETIRAMAVRKMKIGPGIDRGGCTLINEARRATLIQAPGIARIIDAPY